jgi:hypothetical protein
MKQHLEPIHIGRVIISPELLLGWLQYPNGKIRFANLNERLDVILTIEHPDMPLVKEADAIPIVTPFFTQKVDKKGHIISVERHKLEG